MIETGARNLKYVSGTASKSHYIVFPNKELVSHTTQRAGRKAKLRRKARQSGRLRHYGLRLLRATHSFRCWSGAFPQNVRQYVGETKRTKDDNGTRIENMRAVTRLVWAVLGRKMSLRESRGSEMVLK